MSTGLFDEGIGIENDDDKYKRLRHNISICGYKVLTYREDSSNLISDFNLEKYLVFVDPYWNTLTLGPYSIFDLIDKFNKCTMILKLPVNFDTTILKDNVTDVYVTNKIIFVLIKP